MHSRPQRERSRQYVPGSDAGRPRSRCHRSGEAYEAVLHDCAEGAAWFGVSTRPTVIFNEKLSLVGAVPTERYRWMIDWILAGQPGDVIPLKSEAEVGQSAVTLERKA